MLSRNPAAIEKRKQRKRRREGVVSYRVDLPEDLVVDMATGATGLLTDDEALDHTKLERALQVYVLESLKRWQPVRPRTDKS